MAVGRWRWAEREVEIASSAVSIISIRHYHCIAEVFVSTEPPDSNPGSVPAWLPPEVHFDSDMVNKLTLS